jgi:hypothetical protein
VKQKRMAMALCSDQLCVTESIMTDFTKYKPEAVLQSCFLNEYRGATTFFHCS